MKGTVFLYMRVSHESEVLTKYNGKELIFLAGKHRIFKSAKHRYFNGSRGYSLSSESTVKNHS
jgi:hypothetical protein